MSCLIGSVDRGRGGGNAGCDYTTGTIVTVLKSQSKVTLVGYAPAADLKVIGAWRK